MNLNCWIMKTGRDYILWTGSELKEEIIISKRIKRLVGVLIFNPPRIKWTFYSSSLSTEFAV